MTFNNESRSINAGRNIKFAVFNKIFSLCLVFISRKVFIHYIGINYLGINSLFANILTLLSMADLGLGTAMNVSLYEPIAKRDTKKLSALLNYYKRLYNYIALIVTVVGCILLPFLQYIINLDQGIPHIKLYYLIFLANTVVSYLFVYKSSILNADQNSYVVSRIAIIVNSIKVVIQIVTVAIFKLYVVYILLDVCGTVLNNLLISVYADKHYPFLKEKETLSKKDKKNIFSNISSVFLYKISWCLINGTDNILMSILVGTVSVGYYTNYYTLTSNIEAIIALIFSSLTAGIGNLIVTESEKQRYKTFGSMQMISFWLSGVSVCCTYLLANDFIKIWLGEIYVLDNIVLLAITLNLYFSIRMRPVWTFREGTGMYKQIRYIMLMTAILNLILSIIGGLFIGLAGIIFATSISKLLTYFWYEPKILYKNFFKRNSIEYYVEQIINLIIMFFCVIVCSLICSIISLDGVIGWIVKAVICFVISNIVYIIRYYRTKDFIYLKTRIHGVLKGMRH